MKIIYGLLLVFGLSAQTRVQPSQLALPAGSFYKEGDWCPGAVFTLASPTTLVFTKDASPQNTCFLHAATMPTNTSLTAPFTYTVSQWQQAATIDINPGIAPFDDTVFFYWLPGTSPTLHVVGHTTNFLCSGCLLDPPRPTDSFPAEAIIAGFYSVTGGTWALSGHAIVNQHQIYSDVPTTVAYLPETGYFFFLEKPDPPPATAQLEKQLQLSNEAVKQLQVAQAKVERKTAKGLQARMDQVEAAVQSHVETGSPLEVQVNGLRTQIERLREQQQTTGERLIKEREAWIAQQQPAREIAPPAAPGPCEMNTWFRRADVVYWCLSGVWVKTEVWK